MPEMYLDVDLSLAEVPVNLMPLLSDSDFKTRQTAVAHNAAGMDLVWNFITSDGTFTQTAVTPAASGSYAWVIQGDGMYTIQLPNTFNNTEGYGWFTGIATGILPWRGPVVGTRAAALNDSLCDGGNTLDVNVSTLDAAAITAIWNEILDGTVTARQMARILIAACGGVASGLNTTTAVYKNQAGTKTRITATVDADGNRTSVTFTDLS